MTEHNYTPGKAYKMRNGDKAVFVGLKPFTEKTLLFVYKYPNTVNEHTIEGRYWSFNDNHPNDIIGEWHEPKKVKGWVNVYGCYPTYVLCDFYFSKMESDKMSVLPRLGSSKRIACIPIEFTEGEGL